MIPDAFDLNAQHASPEDARRTVKFSTSMDARADLTLMYKASFSASSGGEIIRWQ